MSWTVASQPRPLVCSSEEEGDWSTGICSCCNDMKQCCWVFWCCPCFACKTSKAFGQCLCLPLLDVCSCVHPATMVMRTNVRYHYGIKGSLCTDCVCATCCPSCVWCQMATEMKSRRIGGTSRVKYL
uniref:Cornifelin homolog B-like n=1 Tax=Cynoglossus semilaevis TaxID=244447 RepID=A0A3P8V8Y2_CYNSE